MNVAVGLTTYMFLTILFRSAPIPTHGHYPDRLRHAIFKVRVSPQLMFLHYLRY